MRRPETERFERNVTLADDVADFVMEKLPGIRSLRKMSEKTVKVLNIKGQKWNLCKTNDQVITSPGKTKPVTYLTLAMKTDIGEENGFGIVTDEKIKWVIGSCLTNGALVRFGEPINLIKELRELRKLKKEPQLKGGLLKVAAESGLAHNLVSSISHRPH